jgi:hypothetical protein
MGSEVRFSLSASTERPHPVQGMRAGIDQAGDVSKAYVMSQEKGRH